MALRKGQRVRDTLNGTVGHVLQRTWWAGKRIYLVGALDGTVCWGTDESLAPAALPQAQEESLGTPPTQARG